MDEEDALEKLNLFKEPSTREMFCYELYQKQRFVQNPAEIQQPAPSASLPFIFFKPYFTV